MDRRRHDSRRTLHADEIQDDTCVVASAVLRMLTGWHRMPSAEHTRTYLCSWAEFLQHLRTRISEALRSLCPAQRPGGGAGGRDDDAHRLCAAVQRQPDRRAHRVAAQGVDRRHGLRLPHGHHVLGPPGKRSVVKPPPGPSAVRTAGMIATSAADQCRDGARDMLRGVAMPMSRQHQRQDQRCMAMLWHALSAHVRTRCTITYG